MSLQVYMNNSNQAVIAFQNGNYRESATKYLEAFDASPGKWTENRWQIFHGYTSILQEEYFPASPSDLAALKKISEDTVEAKLYRCEAAFTSGLLCAIAKDREEAAAFYRDVIRIAGKAPEKERKKKVIASITSPDGYSFAGVGPTLVGDLIDGNLQLARNNLRILETSNLNHDAPPSITRLRSDGTSLPRLIRETNILYGPLPYALTKDQAAHLTAVGGERCDCCNKTREESGVSHLQSCSRCKRAFYCSKECQVKKWKAGHKGYCRKPGQIKPGDYVRLDGIQSKPEANGVVVQVIGLAPNQTGRWEVRIPGGDTSLSVTSEKMEHLRPLK